MYRMVGSLLNICLLRTTAEKFLSLLYRYSRYVSDGRLITKYLFTKETAEKFLSL